MTRYQHFRAICSLGLPLILGNIAQISIGVVDTVMTGWYSVEALAALVLGSSFFFVVFILGAGFGHALLPLVASAAAREDADCNRGNEFNRSGDIIARHYHLNAFR